MKQKKKDKSSEVKQTQVEPAEAVSADKLVAKLLQQGDEQFDDTFFTESDRKLIENLPEKQRKTVAEVILFKGALFKKLREKLQRVSADFANFQKRSPRQISDAISYEKETIIKSLLPVLDNFEHTLGKADSAEDVKVLIKGIEIVYDQMLSVLKSHNVEQIEALGEQFNPAYHEAMMQKKEPKREDNIVLEEFQKGYKLNGRVIRPSKVIVNKS